MFTVYSENSLGTTLVSNIFIDNYMKDANDAQLKVYLYLLRMMNAGKSTSISDMADRFNHTEREVLRSIRYWESRGLLELKFDGTGNLAALHMVSPQSQDIVRTRTMPVPFSEEQLMSASGQPAFRETAAEDLYADRSPAASMPRLGQMAIPAQHAPVPAVTAAAPAVTAAVPAVSAAADQTPADEAAGSPSSHSVSSRSAGASTEAIEAFRSSAKRAQLLFVIEQYIGKPLSPKEIESVYYISEQLHFSDSLIDYLLQYCIDRGKKDFRYIEKVAVNWAENGITTPKQAERAVSNFGNRRRGSGAGVKPSANPFNQFEQNQYDFDQLEKEILGN